MPFLPEFTLFDEFELRGLWWNPANPERKVQGRLYWTPHDGGRLELMERLATPTGDPWFTKLHGDVGGPHQTDLPVTIENVFKRRDADQHRGQVVTATRLYCGAHIPSDGEPTLQHTQLRLDGLAEWHGFEPWAMGQAEPVKRVGEREFQFTFRNPDLSVYPVDAIGGNIQFTGGSSQHISRSKVEFEHDLWMVAMVADRSFRDWYDLVHAQFRLITLLSGVKAHPQVIELNLTRQPKGAGPYYQRVRAYFRHSWRRDDWTTPGPAMPFQLTRLPGDLFSRVADRWFRLHHDLGDCMRLLFRQVERSGDEIIPRFLSACQMFEAFHRETRDEPYSDPALYEQWRQQMVAAIPTEVLPDHRNALKSRLKFGNQLSLRTRLRRTFEALPVDIQRVLEVDPKREANAITATRNYYTHLDPSSADRIVEEGELPPISSKLVMTVGYLLWCDLGLEDLVRPGDVHHLWILS